jgi:hypothetical protein
MLSCETDRSRCHPALVAKDLGISRALVYRLASRYRPRAQTARFCHPVGVRAPRSRLLDPEVEALICAVVERTYLQPKRPRISNLLRTVETESLESQVPKFMAFGQSGSRRSQFLSRGPHSV